VGFGASSQPLRSEAVSEIESVTACAVVCFINLVCALCVFAINSFQAASAHLLGCRQHHPWGA
jgi:hypothetical protein